jgi:hypothetical protein
LIITAQFHILLKQTIESECSKTDIKSKQQQAKQTLQKETLYQAKIQQKWN